jgi:competence protein ComEA
MNKFNKLSRKDLLAIIAIVGAVVFGIVFKFLSAPKEIIISEEPYVESVSFETDIFEEPDIILAYITGEVKRPGVYELKEGDRIKDIVDLAGGFTEEADTINVNLAQRLYDEDQVHIAKIGEIPPLGEIINNNKNSELININTATISELTSLPGIGNVKAQNIINYRETFGKFKSIEEINNVTGVGEKTFEALKDLICV